MKLALPLKLTTRHHLVFTFYHITCQTKGGKVDKHTAQVEVRTRSEHTHTFLWYGVECARLLCAPSVCVRRG